MAHREPVRLRLAVRRGVPRLARTRHPIRRSSGPPTIRWRCPCSARRTHGDQAGACAAFDVALGVASSAHRRTTAVAGDAQRAFDLSGARASSRRQAPPRTTSGVYRRKAASHRSLCHVAAAIMTLPQPSSARR
jgi:hypothetical protein